MALPVTITGISTAVAPVGPFKVAAGSYAVLAIDIGPGTFSFALGDSAARTATGQGVTNGSSSINISSITINLGKTGAPTDNIYCEITATDPSGTVVATSNSISGASLTTSMVASNFTFASPPTISASATFGVVFRRTGALDAANYFIIGNQNANAYAGGVPYTHNGSAWATGISDLGFKVNSSVTLASDAYYFFGRDGTTATTLQAFKALSSGYVVTGTGTAGGATACGSTASNYRHAQTWTTDAAAAPISDISFIVGKVGSPTENVRVEIFATSAGAPTGTALATSNVVAAASIIAGGSLTIFSFPTPFVPSASTQYAAVFTKATTTSDASNYYQIYAAAASGTSTYAGGNRYTGSSTNWLSQTNDWSVVINALAPGAPDTSWASIATKTGFTTAILNLAGYQVGSIIHLLVNDGTASTLFATKYVSFDASTDTFLATIETVSAAVAVTGQIAGAGAGASLVVRGNGEVVAFYSGVQAKVSGTFRAHVYYRRRTAVNTWSTETMVDPNTAFDNNFPVAILGAADRVHFVWANPNSAYRTLSAANALNTSGTSASALSPVDGVSYDRAGTTKVVFISGGTTQLVGRFDSSDNPTPSFITAASAVNNSNPHRVGADPVTGDVSIIYRNAADSDLYTIKSTDDGATFGTAVSFFVGTVAAVDTNASRSASGSLYSRAGYDVVGYIVNDNGTWKYNESVVRAPATADAWNVNDKSTNTVLSNGDKTANNPSTTSAVRSTTKRLNGAAGKYYAEIQTVTRFAISSCNVGIKDASAAVSGTPFAARVNGFGDIYIGDTYSGITTAAPADGGVISLAWDTGAKLFWVRTTRDWNDNVANDPATGVGGIDFSSAAAVDHALWSQNGTFTIRTRAAELTQTAPSGFLSWMGETLTVANNGALAAATSSVSGSGIVASAGTGTLNAQSATIVGQGVVASVGTGVLTAVGSVRTNYAKNSQNLDDPTWVGSTTYITRVADAVVAPDGTTTAEQLADTVNSGQHTINTTFFLNVVAPDLIIGDVVTFSVYIKAGTRSWAQLQTTGSIWANFDLAGGVVGSKHASVISHSIQAIANGWYRCSAVFTIAGPSSQSFIIGIKTGDTGATNYVGNGSTIYAWGAQIDKGTVARSYLPTFGPDILPPSAETLIGTGIASWNATGALSASVASASGAGTILNPPATGTGVLTSVAALSGSGVSGSNGTGALLNPALIDIASGSYAGATNFGDAAHPKIGQGFVATAKLITKVRFQSMYTLAGATPVDGAVVKIYTVDGNHAPVAQVGTSSNVVRGAEFPVGAGQPVDFVFPTPVPVSVGTEYIYVLERTGAVSANRYYVSVVNECYGGTTLTVYQFDGTNWVQWISGNYDLYSFISVADAVGLAPIQGTMSGVGLSGSTGAAAGGAASDLVIHDASAAAQVLAAGSIAQTFVATGSAVSKFKVALNHFGPSAGDVQAKLRTVDAAHKPLTEIGASSVVAVSSISNTMTLVEFTFSPPVSVTPGTEYALTATRTLPPVDGNDILQFNLLFVNAYAGGEFFYNDGTTGWQSFGAYDLDCVISFVALGGLLSASSTLAGVGTVADPVATVTGTGALAAVGSVVPAFGTGALTSGAGVVAGAGDVITQFRAVIAWVELSATAALAPATGTGVLVATQAVVAGTGLSRSVGTGTLPVLTLSTLAGVGVSRSVSTLGALAPSAAVTAGAGLSRSVSTSASLSVSAAAIGSVGISRTTGTGTLACSVATLVGVGLNTATGTGALTSFATLSGAGVARWVGTGILSASTATMVSAGVVQWIATAVLNANAASLAGAGASSSTQTASALQASLASVSGFQGVVIVSGVGTLQSQSAVAVGAAVSRSLGTGALLDATAALAGAGLSGTQGASLLVPTACVITASGKSISSGTATLSAGISVASGVGGIAAAPTGTGILLSDASSVTGVGSAALTASGILNAQSATVSGSGAATWIASGVLASSVSVAAGAGLARWSGLGVLTSVAATTASLGASSSAGSASLLSARASVFGAEGVVVIQGAGALQAQSRVIAGVGAARHTGSGALFSQDHAASGIGLGRSFGTGLLPSGRSVLDAIAVVQATGSGLLAAKRALMSGFASLTAYGTGDLDALNSVISGNDFIYGLGVLPSSYSTLAGEGNVGYPAYPEPDPLPGSYPGTTTWVYAGTAGWVNPGTRGWVNPGTAEWRKRAA
jgi:hypothetical protein